MEKTKKYKLKPMIYSIKSTCEILAHDTYCGYEFCIINRGTHPCAYIRIPNDNKLYHFYSDVLENVMLCHGGITWESNRVNGLPKENKNNKKWLGWDYAHCCDYFPYDFNPNDDTCKKWTTEEIFKEIKEVIDRLEKYKAELN